MIVIKIDMIILDVDGTLTDCTIFYSDNNIETKAFSAKDGAILGPLNHLGIEIVFLTGRKSEAVARRARDLNAEAIQGVAVKAPVLGELLAKRNVNPKHCAYIGDDLNDYAAMKMCGFKACPSDAAEEIRDLCDYVSPYRGGHGAVRDICEHILKQTGKYDDFLNHYGVDC